MRPFLSESPLFSQVFWQRVIILRLVLPVAFDALTRVELRAFLSLLLLFLIQVTYCWVQVLHTCVYFLSPLALARVSISDLAIRPSVRLLCIFSKPAIAARRAVDRSAEWKSLMAQSRTGFRLRERRRRQLCRMMR